MAARTVFCAMAFAAPRFLRPTSPVARREGLLVALTFACVAAFGLALFVYKDANYYLQAMSVLLMINAVFLVPNRFSVSVGFALLLAAIGCMYVSLPSSGIPVALRPALLVDTLLMALVSSIVWLRTCRSKRREFIESMKLERLSRTDQLTGLGNRRDLEIRLAEAHARSARHGERYALMLVDLDRFKSLNDNYGHEAGDAALRETARRLTSSLRSEDSVYRWGGEEFVILLSNATIETALESARRLWSALRSTPLPLSGTLTASIGLTMLRPDESSQDAVARADIALYRAKDAGRDRIELEP